MKREKQMKKIRKKKETEIKLKKNRNMKQIIDNLVFISLYKRFVLNIKTKKCLKLFL